MQQNKITHLEKLVEDLLARVVKAEDKANKAYVVATRSSRAKLALGPTYTTEQIKQLEDRMGKFQDRLQEVERIVEQINDTST